METGLNLKEGKIYKRPKIIYTKELEDNLKPLSLERGFTVETLKDVGILRFNTVKELSDFLSIERNKWVKPYLEKFFRVLKEREISMLNEYLILSYLSDTVIYFIRYNVENKGKKIKYENVDIKEKDINKKTKVYGLDTLDYSKDSIYVVEGVFDRVRLYKDRNVISLLGTELTPYVLEILKRFKEVYLTLDNDNAGNIANNKIKKELIYNKHKGIIYERKEGFGIKNSVTYLKDIDDVYKNGYTIEDVKYE